MNPVPDTLLIDLDGVIRDWRHQDGDIEVMSGLPTGTIRSTLFEPSLLQRAITGRIDDATWRRIAIEEMEARFPEAQVSTAMTLWSQPAGDLNRDVVAILERVRPATTLILVTNATSRLSEDVSRLGIADLFDHIINSSDVGIAKPDTALFRHALRTAGTKAANAVFVDDSPANVAAAAQLGIRSHAFEDVHGMRRFLASCDIVC